MARTERAMGDFQPIKVEGPPLSEQIIRDRP